MTGKKYAHGVVAALSAATVIIGSAAPAQSEHSPLQSLALMNGKCIRLIIAGHDQSAHCMAKLINESFESGRTGFTFTAGDAAVISFSGMGPRQVKLTADKVYQPVDRLIFTLLGMGTPPNNLSASGSCTYTNPYAGPSHVSCTAHTAHGDFAATFLSDGREPEVRRF